MSHNEETKEVELELTLAELELFGKFCKEHDIKFNDWVRALAHEAVAKASKK